MHIVIRFSDGSTLEFDGEAGEFRTLIEKLETLMKHFREGVELAKKVMAAAPAATPDAG